MIEDSTKVKELETKLAEAVHEISGAFAYLKSCGYLDMDQSEPEYQMTKSFENFLKSVGK